MYSEMECQWCGQMFPTMQERENHEKAFHSKVYFGWKFEAEPEENNDPNCDCSNYPIESRVWDPRPDGFKMPLEIEVHDGGKLCIHDREWAFRLANFLIEWGCKQEVKKL